MDEPRLKEVTIRVVSSGTVQIVKFNLQNTFHVEESQTWEFPESWDAAQVEEYVQEVYPLLQEKVDARAQPQQDALIDASDWYTPND